MNVNTPSPTLGKTIRWTAIFYAGFGLVVAIVGWFISMGSSNILLRMLGLNIPDWATGWIFLLAGVPMFAVLGAISGVIIYWPVRALARYLRGSQQAAS